MSKPAPPFSCTYSPNVPELMNQLNVTLAISTYQAGKVILLSALNNQNLVQLPRNFKKPMGIATMGEKMALATQGEVLILANAGKMAKNYPKQPDTYDALFLPRATYYTGEVDIHDLHWVGQELWAVNTRFSCLSAITENYNFEPRWQPSFITQLTPEDRCHLNGLAIKNNSPKYVTALGQSDSREGWRENKTTGGIIIDVESNEVISRNLPMPHSPRIYDDALYVLLSATGELVKVNIQNGAYEVVKQLNGFVRGMARFEDYLFVGLSKLRKKSVAFGDLPIAETSQTAGIVIIHLPTASVVGQIKYETSVEEIYDVKVLPGLNRPGLLNTERDDHRIALSIPGAGYWAIRENKH